MNIPIAEALFYVGLVLASIVIISVLWEMVIDWVFYRLGIWWSNHKE